MEYIKPNLIKYNTLKELLEAPKNYPFIEPNTKIEDLPLRKNNLVISEPGLGKTRFLKEILLNRSAKEGIFLDLKRLKKKERTALFYGGEFMLVQDLFKP